MSDDFNNSGASAPPPGSSGAPSSARRRSSNSTVGWLVAAVVVLVLAVAGGLFTAWLVANMRAVPAGPIAAMSPTPSAIASSCLCTPTPAGSGLETTGPRRTPTPLPTVELTPAPFTYTVQPGDHLVNIANLYGVSMQDVMELNGITNPNRIAVGQELLIPGYGVQPTPKPTKPPKK